MGDGDGDEMGMEMSIALSGEECICARSKPANNFRRRQIENTGN